MFDVENIRAMHESSKDKCLWIAFSERSDKTVDMLSEHFLWSRFISLGMVR